MVKSEVEQAIPVWPMSMKTETGTYTDKLRHGFNVVHFNVDGDITVTDKDANTNTASFIAGCDIALSPEIVSFTTTGEVMIG